MTTASAETATDVLKVIVYSDDRIVREQIRLALGRRIASDLPEVVISEFATYDAAIKAMDNERFDAAVFDGEATPGGMGLAHQIKDEIPGAPPVVLLIARAADAWLATWSNADGVSPYPVDPIRLPDDVAQVVRDARAGRRGPLAAGDVVPGVSSRHDEGDRHDIPDFPGTKHGPSKLL
ncbi:hypothetical protein GCM10009785_18680 [Brooklawnia cerclae]|uniref:DNA-binding NarL/FixJ family response regulator n=1 Tax=Brooklawnia cerclae TaxID=349934 RepID=A0ABX0SGQ1_9ACTN|nr:response regulator transcription factor [Brooklawnia cerclae]NIH57559.1 DNA-binding NarL/FixJ family response regulator [Brooklawnia cerclae]